MGVEGRGWKDKAGRQKRRVREQDMMGGGTSTREKKGRTGGGGERGRVLNITLCQIHQSGPIILSCLFHRRESATTETCLCRRFTPKDAAVECVTAVQGSNTPYLTSSSLGLPWIFKLGQTLRLVESINSRRLTQNCFLYQYIHIGLKCLHTEGQKKNRSDLLKKLIHTGWSCDHQAFLFQIGGIRWIVTKCVIKIDVWCHTGHEQRSPEWKSCACLTQPPISSLTFHSLYLASSFAAVIITTATRGRCFYLWSLIFLWDRLRHKYFALQLWWCIPLPRPNRPFNSIKPNPITNKPFKLASSIVIRLKLFSHTETRQLNMLADLYHQSPWISPWEITESSGTSCLRMLTKVRANSWIHTKG